MSCRTASPSSTTSVSALTSIDSGSSLSTTPTSTTQFTPTQNLTDPTNTTSRQSRRQHRGHLVVYLAAPTSSLSSSSTHAAPRTSTTAFRCDRHHILTAVSSHELPATTTAAPGTTENYNHRLIINLGDCLIAGEMSDLFPIGDGRFEIGLKADPQNSVFGLIVSLKDEGVRCGSEDYASCTAIDIGFGATSELIMNVLMAGDYSKDMYPFSIWLEDGTCGMPNCQLARGNVQLLGWTDAECPYAIKHPPNPEPDAHEWGNESTYVVLPSQMAIPTRHSSSLSGYALSVPTPTTVPLCDQPSDCVTFSTYIVQEGTTTVRSTFVTPHQIRRGTRGLSIFDSPDHESPIFLLPVRMVVFADQDKDPRSNGNSSIESRTAISTLAPTLVPTYSYITDGLGSTMSTSSYDLTLVDTWMTINGSTVPAIAGEVGVLTTVSMTYLLESGSIIPVSELSTEALSSQTSDPSPTLAVSADNDQTKQNQGGKIAGAVVGTLVGLVLGSLVVCRIGRWIEVVGGSGRGTADEQLVHSALGSAEACGLATEKREPARDGECAGAYGVSVLSVPTATATRIGKPSTWSESTLEPNAMVSQRPVSSSHISTSLASPSMSLLPTPFQDEPPSERTPTSPPSRATPISRQEALPTRAEPSRRRQLHDEEQGRHDAIPPLYNEAWNTAR
ncbi:hypothetical protein RHS01_00295 [Rhizoctonia solani]|uniref:Uncharacterized protein n=1 Tax=Rhizoctonia solani TaxID=456999 RepID=A0A8H7INE7_9AGAM|nr:hypothetical protein RHS01_00295 [Rhizoctonia solani]